MARRTATELLDRYAPLMNVRLIDPRRVAEGDESLRLLAETLAGPLLLRGRGGALTAIEFGGEGGAADSGPQELLVHAERQLRGYFEGEREAFDLPCAPAGTEFQLQVWRALLEIPFGRVESYADLARRIGRPQAVRAVGAANGANPLPIVIPCHRVIGADGRLTGYGGGIETKRRLLQLEGVVRPRLGTSPGLFPNGGDSGPGRLSSDDPPNLDG